MSLSFKPFSTSDYEIPLNPQNSLGNVISHASFDPNQSQLMEDVNFRTANYVQQLDSVKYDGKEYYGRVYLVQKISYAAFIDRFDYGLFSRYITGIIREVAHGEIYAVTASIYEKDFYLPPPDLKYLYKFIRKIMSEDSKDFIEKKENVAKLEKEIENLKRFPVFYYYQNPAGPKFMAPSVYDICRVEYHNKNVITHGKLLDCYSR